MLMVRFLMDVREVHPQPSQRQAVAKGIISKETWCHIAAISYPLVRVKSGSRRFLHLGYRCSKSLSSSADLLSSSAVSAKHELTTKFLILLDETLHNGDAVEFESIDNPKTNLPVTQSRCFEKTWEWNVCFGKLYPSLLVVPKAFELNGAALPGCNLQRNKVFDPRRSFTGPSQDLHFD
jgi:hypothetical protein